MAQFDNILMDKIKRDIDFENLIEATDDIDTIDILSNIREPDPEYGDPEDDDESYNGSDMINERIDDDE